jgi:hypothetical protein
MLERGVRYIVTRETLSGYALVTGDSMDALYDAGRRS